MFQILFRDFCNKYELGTQEQGGDTVKQKSFRYSIIVDRSKGGRTVYCRWASIAANNRRLVSGTVEFDVAAIS